MNDEPLTRPAPLPTAGHVVIVGFGVPGRTLADELHERGVPYVVLELNPGTVNRCARTGVPILQGSGSNLEALRSAGVAAASLVALMVPDDKVVVDAVSLVRQLNPDVPLIARCAFTSAGMEALRRANETIVAEQIVARELLDVFGRLRAGAVSAGGGAE